MPKPNETNGKNNHYATGRSSIRIGMLFDRDSFHRNHLDSIMMETVKNWTVVLQYEGREEMLSDHHPRKHDAIAWSRGMNLDVKEIRRDGSQREVIVVDVLDEMYKEYKD